MNDTEEVELPGGRMARYIPFSERNGACAAFMLRSGQIRCRHGNSESTLRRLKREDDPSVKIRCECDLKDNCWRQLCFGNATKRENKVASCATVSDALFANEGGLEFDEVPN